MFQFAPFTPDDLTGNVIGETIQQGAGMEIYFLYVLIFLAVMTSALLVARYFLTRYFSLKESFKRTVLLILVPREALSGDKKSPETLSNIHEDISVAETFLSAIGGLKYEKGFWPWLTGKKQVFSFEIVVEKGMISFYVVVPRKDRDFIEQQIHAQYPSAQIEEIKDYNIFSPRGSAYGVHLVFKRPSAFPIKTYRKLDSDPLNSITNALQKIGKDDGAAIQIMLRSAPPYWRGLGRKIVREMQKGKKLDEVVTKNIVKEIFKLIASSSKSSAPEGQKEPPRQLTQLEQEMLKGLEEKMSKAGIEANIRIVTSSASFEKAKMYADNIINSFGQYSVYEYGNAFQKITSKSDKILRDFIYRNFNERRRIVLNTEELASLYHFPLPSTETPNIKWLSARSAEPPSNIPAEGLILGRSMYRGEQTIIRLDEEARRRHLYTIGQTGTGKSTLFQELIKQDIKNGKGVCVIDPHGDLVEDVIGCVPKERVDDVIYYNPADTERPMGLNLLEFDPAYPEQKTFVINELISIFDKLFDLKTTGGPMFEQYMRNALLLIMDDPESGSTLAEIPKVLSDANFRKYKLSKSKTQVVKDFWTKEAEKAGGETALANLVPYVTSKLTPFIANDIMRPIISQQHSSFNLREIMDNKKILLLNLSKGKLGDINAYLLGMVLVGKIWAAALSRADAPQEKRHDFYLYIDEFQNFTTDTIASILSEARKYRLCLGITHQFIGQLSKAGDTKIRDAVFGNVGNIISFRIGPEDGEFMEKQFGPVFNAHDLLNISNFNCYVKMIIGGQVSRAFNMEIFRHFDPWYPGAEEMFGLKSNEKIAKAIKELSRLKYGRDRHEIETDIAKRANVVVKEEEEEEDIEEDEEK